MRFTDNLCENAIRPFVPGRRNDLFAGSDDGGESAAVIDSLIGTARLNGIEPFEYLRTVFERIADHPINRIDEVLPWRLMPAAHIEQQAGGQSIRWSIPANLPCTWSRRQCPIMCCALS